MANAMLQVHQRQTRNRTVEENPETVKQRRLDAEALILANERARKRKVKAALSEDGLELVIEEADQPEGVADMSLEAPEEGGPFSTFFNSHHTGQGIHKWLQYFPAYQRHLGKFIGKEVHIMEIGIQSGGSLDMWKGVFGPGAHVYGCDINPECKAYEDTRTKVFIGDQASPEFWEGVKKQVPRIDILIDDGEHTPEQQIATLGLMLQHLSPDGVYITEDVHGVDNPFWQRLRFEQLDSPAGQHYRGFDDSATRHKLIRTAARNTFCCERWPSSVIQIFASIACGAGLAECVLLVALERGDASR